MAALVLGGGMAAVKWGKHRRERVQPRH
jgi:hypothetical protein